MYCDLEGCRPTGADLSEFVYGGGRLAGKTSGANLSHSEVEEIDLEGQICRGKPD